MRKKLRAAKRLKKITPFKVMELLSRANELDRAGRDVIHLEVGEPDFETPMPIINAAHEALKLDLTKYTDARGNFQLRESISDYYASRFDMKVEIDRIFVTTGASGGLLLLTGLLINAGENLLMADPGYPCNQHFLTCFGGEGRLVPVSAGDNYQLTPQLMTECWDQNTRGILVASPANPTGSVMAAEDLEILYDFVNARDGIFLVDEIYQGLSYEKVPVHTALSASDNIFVVNSFSKYFGMTGWRLGWVVVPEGFAPDLEKLAQNLFICSSAIAQYAALAAFSAETLEIMEFRRNEFAKRRNFLLPALKELGFEIPIDPAGAFYVYCGLPSGLEDCERFCRRLLESEFVAITPGTDFGYSRTDRMVRISYARDILELEEAVVRIERALR